MNQPTADRAQRAGRSMRDQTAMRLIGKAALCVRAIREFIAPTYQPERHYMRGPGPACARRVEVRAA